MFIQKHYAWAASERCNLLPQPFECNNDADTEEGMMQCIRENLQFDSSTAVFMKALTVEVQ